MDEQVIQDLYNRARGKGYTKGIEDFKILLATDNEVVDDNYSYVRSQGYRKSREEFLTLVGVTGQAQPTATETVTETVVEEPKKKEDIATESPSTLEEQPSLSELQQAEERDFYAQQRESSFQSDIDRAREITMPSATQPIPEDVAKLPTRFVTAPEGDVESTVELPDDYVSPRQQEVENIKQQITKIYGVEPRDPREPGYEAASTEDLKISIFPGREEREAAERFNKQQQADQAYLNFLKASEKKYLAQQQESDRAEQKEIIASALESRAEVLESEEFANDLSQTTPEAMKMKEAEAANYFNNLYGKYGFTFRPVNLVKNQLEVSILLSDGNVKTERINVSTFQNDINGRSANKIKDFVKRYAYKPSEARELMDSNPVQSSLRVKDMRPVARINEDGMHSTVLMQSATIDGKNVAFPTLFPNSTSANEMTNNPKDWMELEGMEAYQEALRRGEVFTFETEEEASNFAKGSWKDINTVDAEADRFFDERGYDYLTVKDQFDEYEDARDRVAFIDKVQSGFEDTRFKISDFTDDERELYEEYIEDFYDPRTGQLRNDIDNVQASLQRTVDGLADTYLDSDLQRVAEDFDAFTQKKVERVISESVEQNNASLYIAAELNAVSMQELGVPIAEVNNFTPLTPEQEEIKEVLQTSYLATQDAMTIASNKYEVAKTYLSSKFDEQMGSDLTEGWGSMGVQISEGWNRGQAGDEILKVAMGLSGDSTEEIAANFVNYMQNTNSGETSREMNRWNRSKGYREMWDAFSDNPLSLSVGLAANSISQMLPYGMKIIPSMAATGTAVGAGLGSVVPGAGTAAGAASGFGYGTMAGFSATSFGLEYTNAVMDAMKEQGYDILDTNDVAKALQDDKVWEIGRERGLKRGIPIAVVDLLSQGLAGRVFSVGKTSARGTRLAVQAGERILFDPLMEGTGEYLAQVTVGDDVNVKEILAEMMGGFGNNAPAAAINTALDLRGKNNVDIANELTTIEGVNAEVKGLFSPSPTRVSNWANSMQELGQISKEQNQRIQENLGIRQDALNVLEVNNKPTSNDVLNRTMNLMANRNELESTPERKKVFAGKIKEINEELAELAETKTVRSPDAQTNLQGVGSALSRPTGATDVRRSQQAVYKIDGKKVDRRKFLSRLNDMSVEQLGKTSLEVRNDNEVFDLLTEKIGADAIQEQEAGTVSDVKQAGDISQVETEVRDSQPKQTEELETEETAEVVEAPAPIKHTAKDRAAFKNNKLSPERLDGIISFTLDKEANNEVLNDFEQTVLEENKSRVDEIVSLKTLKEEATDLEQALGLEQAPAPTTEAAPAVTEETTVTEEVTTPATEQQKAGYNKRIEKGIRDANKATTTKKRAKALQTIKTNTTAIQERHGESFVTAEQQAEIDRLTQELADEGVQISENVQKGKEVRLGSQIVKVENFEKDNTLPIGTTIIGRVVTPELFDSDGNLVQQGKVDVRVGTRKFTQAEANAKIAEIEAKRKNALNGLSEQFHETINEDADADIAEVRKNTEAAPAVTEETTVTETTTEAAPTVETDDVKQKRLEFQSDIEVSEDRIQEANEEIANEKSNLKEEIARINDEIKKVRANKKLNREQKADAIEDLKAQKEDAKDETAGLIENYKYEIKDYKSDIRKANTGLKKLDKKPKVDFKSEEQVVEDVDEVASITTKINELQSGNTETNLDETPSEGTIDVDELNERTDTPLKSIDTLEIINGVPVVFTISDQLRTGVVVNPNTGRSIDNLKGGMGFTGTQGHQGYAWANTSREEAGALYDKAKAVYEANKEALEDFWAKNPEYNNHVPMPVVKMGEGSILSNEATFRVLADNLKAVPEQNRVRALEVLKTNLKTNITRYAVLANDPAKADLTVVNYLKKINNLNQSLKLIEDSGATSIDDIFSEDFIKSLSLPARRELLERMTYGSPNRAGTKVTPGKPKKPTVLALLNGMDLKESAKLFHLGEITDIITEPQLANIPQRNIVALQAVDIGVDREGSILETTHPNYPFGTKGKSIGVLKNPVSVVRAFPVAYQNAIADLIKREGQRKKVTESLIKRTKKADRAKLGEVGDLAPSSVGTILTQTLGVQNGLPNAEFVGAISQGNVDNVFKLTAFMNVAFPQTNISTSQTTFDTIMQRDDVRQFKKGGQIIYGVTVDGDVYINPQVHNSESSMFNTAIHEMGHVWTDYLTTTKKGKEIYNKGVTLVKQTQEYQKQLKKFDGDTVAAARETMAILIGNKGQKIADASVKSKFNEWLVGMWNYIKSQFKQTSKLTAEEIQNLTLDEFIGSALADILSGKEIKLTDAQMKKMKNPEVAFRSDLTINEIIEQGREMLFSDASIKQVLLGRGFGLPEINEAMIYKVDTNETMPNAFQRIEGGILEAAKLYNDVNQKLNAFAYDTKGKRIKTYSEIRQKAQELIKAHPVFKKQSEQVQTEVLVAFDRELGYTSNRPLQRQMQEKRKALRQRIVGRQNLKDAQIELKNYIRQNLPRSKNYSQAKINRLIKAVTDIRTIDDYRKQIEKVDSIIETQRAMMKRDTISEIFRIVKDKSRPRKQSGKNRPKGIDAVGQVVFKNIKQVMDAVMLKDADERQAALEDIRLKLDANRNVIDNALSIAQKGENLTLREEELVQLQLAYDTFADLDTMTLEEVQALLEDVKITRKESILRLDARREQRVAEAEAVAEQTNEQIKETNPELYNEDGQPKGQEQLNSEQDIIKQDFSARGILKKVFEKISKDLLGRREGSITNFKNILTHLGTVTNFLDNKPKGLTIFTDKVYKKLNRMGEVFLQNLRSEKRGIDEIAKELGFKKGMQSVEQKLNTLFGLSLTGVPKNITIQVKSTKTGAKFGKPLNANQLLRIYALSKNPVQAAKLKRQGIDADVLADIQTKLGPELTAFADKMVEYLSTDYFNGLNSVYRQVNGVNLGYIENYFPTKTIITDNKAFSDMVEAGDFIGVFSAETSPAFKNRVDKTSDVNLSEATFTGTLMNHMEAMERYKAYAVGVQKLNAFFRIESVNTLMEQAGVKQLVMQLVNSEINPQSAANALGVNRGGTIAEKFQTKFTSFVLSFKPIQVLKQATSFYNAKEDYNLFAPNSRVPSPIRSAIEHVMFPVDMAGVFLGMLAFDMFGFNGPLSKAREMSATLDDRFTKGLEGDVYTIESGSQTLKQAGKKSGVFQRLRRGVKKAGGSFTVLGDIAGVMGYYVNYKRNIANGMTQAQALDAFNEYDATQQPRRTTNRAPIQLRNDFGSRMVTMFGSVAILQLNKVMSSATNIRRSLAQGKIPSKKDTRALAINLAIANVLFTAAANIALLTKGDDDDMAAFKRKLIDAALGLNLLYQIPFLGIAVEEGVAYYRGEKKSVDVGTNPISPIFRKIKKGIKDNPDKFFEKLITPIIEIVVGFQSDPIIGLYNVVQEGMFGDTTSEEYYENVYDALGISPSYRPGYGDEKGELEGVIPIGGVDFSKKSELKRYDPDLYEEYYGEEDREKKAEKEERARELREDGYIERGGKLYPID